MTGGVRGHLCVDMREVWRWLDLFYHSFLKWSFEYDSRRVECQFMCVCVFSPSDCQMHIRRMVKFFTNSKHFLSYWSILTGMDPATGNVDDHWPRANTPHAHTTHSHAECAIHKLKTNSKGTTQFAIRHATILRLKEMVVHIQRHYGICKYTTHWWLLGRMGIVAEFPFAVSSLNPPPLALAHKLQTPHPPPLPSVRNPFPTPNANCELKACQWSIKSKPTTDQ